MLAALQPLSQADKMIVGSGYEKCDHDGIHDTQLENACCNSEKQEPDVAANAGAHT